MTEKIIVLDGATGTELQKRGMPAGVCPEEWCRQNPSVIESVHADYVRAGSNIVYTCTFGANRVKLSQFGVTDVSDVNHDLAQAARRAVGTHVLVAGDVGPTGRFVEPFGDLSFDEAVDIFTEQVRGLIAGGVDLIVIETMMDIQEARAALVAVRELSRIETMVTMTYETSGKTLNGTDTVAALVTLQSLGADAVGCNCSTGPAEMLGFIRAMKPYATVPLVAKPNAGMPELVDGETVFTMTPDAFAGYARDFVTAGVNILGGCCGTTPSHIAELVTAVQGMRPVLPVRLSLSALSSARRAEILEGQRSLCVIGERINPTGKKGFQEELRERKWTYLRKTAREQEEKGARLLDVNVGMPGIDQVVTMKDAVKILATMSPLPLVIDSADADTVKTALRHYPGRVLINSISGERERREELFPLAAKYGAMFICLPLADDGVPETADARVDIVKDIWREAQQFGLDRADMIIDGLVMTVSSKPQGPLETLKTIEWASREFGCNTVVGLSNVSFGMPERKWINAAFLAMAVSRGATLAIANPDSETVMSIAAASDVLDARDKDAAAYIGRFAEKKDVIRESDSVESTVDAIFYAVVEGRREEVDDLLNAALAEGEEASRLVHDVMIPAITRVGELFDTKEYFLPQLIASAETMKRGVAYLEPYLKEDAVEETTKGVVLMATVDGDIHDIGKNIVSLLLGNHGFEIVDLGKDVSAETIAEAARSRHPSIIGLSALMTTTMVNIESAIKAVRAAGVNCHFMVGGAVVTEDFALSLGARYAKDGVSAVRLAEELSGKDK